MQDVYSDLIDILGKEYVSNQPEELYLYSMDPGTQKPRKPDFVALPENADQVQQILRLANEKKIPVYCMGSGLVLSGLMRPLKGGILMDMKRMDKILEVNETSRYAVVEAGATQGFLQAYLNRHHPRLKHSMPDAPPSATIAGNVLIHGSGHLSQANGFHSDMLNGLEVVLPTGEIAKLGSCATSPYWFSRAPLPDLSSLFIGWSGTTGVVTKLAIKLYPRYSLEDVRVLVNQDIELMPEILRRITETQVAEDIYAWMTPVPDWASGYQHLNITYAADSEQALIWKRNLIREAVKEYIDKKVAGFMMLPSFMKHRFLEVPSKTLATFADVRKGGGFEYVGAMMPVELFQKAYELGNKVAEETRVAYSMGSRIIGRNHCMMFFYAYAFNRADPEDMKRAQNALEKTNEQVLKLGGIPWKAELPAQKQILENMDPNTYEFMQKIRSILDPNHIMSPGNWEAN